MRTRDKNHLTSVRSRPCMNCKTDQNIEAHHLLRIPIEKDGTGLKMDQTNGMGLKIGDNWTIPLCRSCHRAVHDAGSEVRAWGKDNAGIAVDLAFWLWNQSEVKK